MGGRMLMHSKIRYRELGFHPWWVVFACSIALLLPPAVLAQGVPYQLGDVFVSVSNGKVQHWNPQGTTLLETLDSLKSDTFQGSSTTGMAFDSIGNLYLTTFVGGDVTKFDNKGVLIGTFGTGYSGFPESILFDRSGNAYVGSVDSPNFQNPVRKFDPAGNPLGSFAIQPEVRGSDWIDLAGDQCTLFYTSEGISILRFNLCSQQQLANFNLTALPGRAAYALRILPSGGVLVADTSVIVRLDAAGNQIQPPYDAPGEDCWFALNLDPDGKSFWSADFCSSQVHKFDIESGTELLRFSTGTAPGTVFGLAVFGEITTTGRPNGFSGTVVGNGEVALQWVPYDPPETVDGYNLYAELVNVDGSVSNLGKVDECGLPIPNSVGGCSVTKFANDGDVQNDKLYRFSLTALKNGVESPPSDFVLARPGQFAVARPIYPILFLHGIFPGSAASWNDVVKFFRDTLGWVPGGTLRYAKINSNDPNECPSLQPLSLVPDADFYTAQFGNTAASYPASCGNNGIAHQATEVQGFVKALRPQPISKKLTILAQSMGGLAARSYIANPTNFTEVGERIKNFFTYGTPHWGTFAGAFNPLLGDNPGLKDMLVNCTSDGHLTYVTNAFNNQFLDTLRNQTLPKGIRYLTIRGNSKHRIADCLATRSDFAVPIDSADFNGRGLILVPNQLFHPNAPADQRAVTPDTPADLLETNRVHLSETSDISGILCALAPKCLLVHVQSPVDVKLMPPSGRSVGPQLVELPAASYMQIEDQTGAVHPSVLVPFPQTGQYTLMVLAKPGSSPTDTFSITATVGDATTNIAQNMRVQDAPPGGFQFMVDGNSAPIADAGPNEMMPAGSPTGTAVTLDGSGSVDPDGDPITYRWTGPFPEGNGMASGVHPVVTLQPGNNQLTLVVNDGHVDSTPATITVTLTDFDVSASSTSATVSAGQSATYDLTINPKFGAFGSAISLSCLNLPALTACSFSPNSLTPGAASATSKLTITTTAGSVASSSLSLPQPFDLGHGRLALGLLFPLLFLVVLLKRRKLSTSKVGLAYGLAIALSFLLLMQNGCNSGNAQPPAKPGTPPGAYSITVTGSSGNLQHQITVTLTVH